MTSEKSTRAVIPYTSIILVIWIEIWILLPVRAKCTELAVSVGYVAVAPDALTLFCRQRKINPELKLGIEV